MFLWASSLNALADPVSIENLASGGAKTRDLQMSEMGEVLLGGRGGFFDLGFYYTPAPSQLKLQSPYGEHEGFAFKHHLAGFGSGEIAKDKHLGFLLWFERSGWDGEDFILFPSYNDFAVSRSVTTWGLVFTESGLNVTAAAGMQHQNLEFVGDIYPSESDSLVYSWAHLRFKRVSVQGSAYKTDWRHARVSLDLESREIYGGAGSGITTYLPNVDLAIFNREDDDDSLTVSWEQNLYNQQWYGEVVFDVSNGKFHSGALKFYPDASRMMAFEATCLRREKKNGHEDYLWGGALEFPFLRFAYNAAYDYENFFGAKGTFLVEVQFNIGTIDNMLFSRGARKSAPMETIKLQNKKNAPQEDKTMSLTPSSTDGPSKTLEAKGVRYEKANGAKGGN